MLLAQDTKSDVAHSNVTLCFIILACVTEDQYASALMHDPNLVFKVGCGVYGFRIFPMIVKPL